MRSRAVGGLRGAAPHVHLYDSRLASRPSTHHGDLSLPLTSLSTVPPKRLNWTVILVAMEGSQKAATSCAAKMRRGLLLWGQWRRGVQINQKTLCASITACVYVLGGDCSARH